MSAILTLLLLLAPAQASTPASSTTDGIVMRPDTYEVDAKMSAGRLENFFKVFVDPDGFADGLVPTAPPDLPRPPAGQPATGPSFPPKGQLVLINDRVGEATYTIGGTEVGVIKSLTEAVVHDVRTGCYDVTRAYMDDHVQTDRVCTVATVRTPFPGGPSAAVWLDEPRPARDEPAWRYGPPDQDKDGVADTDDECPNEPGPAASFGCPDGDGDRVPDFRDDCPKQAGPAQADPRRSDGCPARVFVAAKSIVITDKIFFQTNKAAIKKESFGLLDELVAVLVKHPEIHKVEIAGHTDDVGNDSANLTLSDTRARSVMAYFTDKGIDAARLTAKGYGETQPIADNGTAEGKATNRRVEFQILEQDEKMISVPAGPKGQGPETPAEPAPQEGDRTLDRGE